MFEGGTSEAVQPGEYPSRQWFLKWRDSLLLGNLKVCVQHTYAKTMDFRSQISEESEVVNIDEEELAVYLEKFSLKGLLPVMPKILVTTYKGNNSIDTWLVTYLWTLIFTTSQNYHVFD